MRPLRRALYRLFAFLARCCVAPGDTSSTDAGDLLMAMIPEVQAQLDRMGGLATKISDDKAAALAAAAAATVAAVAAAEAGHVQDVADSVAGLAKAVDALGAVA